MAPLRVLRPLVRSSSSSSSGILSFSSTRGPRWFREESTPQRRHIHVDHRNRLSNVWVPPPQVLLKDAKQDEESHAKLLRAGFLRQAHSGVFHLLPLGLRIQDKIEALVDRHMKAIGASRVSLSSISSARLWTRSGRLESVKPELFQFKDRKDAQYLLAPTHEEEITELVAQNVQSYRGLPLRLYQITRKYRDEMRPRHGILRSREFVMKDLYTFDASVDDALATYEQVRGAYAKIFATLKVPVLAARASSGDMGGDLSHEYHLAASLGEDDVAHCSQCGYAANTEVLADTRAKASPPDATPREAQPSLVVQQVRAWRGISRDRRTLVNVWYPAVAVDPSTGRQIALTDDDIDIHAVQLAVPDLDAGVDNAVETGNAALARETTAAAAEQPAAEKLRVLNLLDGCLRGPDAPSIDPSSWPASKDDKDGSTAIPDTVAASTVVDADPDGRAFHFSKARTGDACPACGADGALTVDRAIELGHTFYLGTRYTAANALNVRVQAPPASSGAVSSSSSSPSVLHPLMGCYGIGVSRILAAVADHRADAQGLNWPRAIAPYEVVVVAAAGGAGAKQAAEGKSSSSPMLAAAETVYDALAGRDADDAGPDAGPDADPIDVVLDDRPNATLPYKLKDADLTGYPVVVVVGAAWRRTADAAGRNGVCEVQCRQLGVRQDVPLRELRAVVQGLLAQL